MAKRAGEETPLPYGAESLVTASRIKTALRGIADRLMYDDTIKTGRAHLTYVREPTGNADIVSRVIHRLLKLGTENDTPVFRNDHHAEVMSISQRDTVKHRVGIETERVKNADALRFKRANAATIGYFTRLANKGKKRF